jgi:hypothetical protein
MGGTREIRPRASQRTVLRTREEVLQMDDAMKFVMLLTALYGTYRSARTAWRLIGELFG